MARSRAASNPAPSSRRRRRALIALAAALAAPLRALAQKANEHVSTIDPLLWSFTQGADVLPGRVTLEIPLLAENGHSVPMTVRVDSPMTERDHVRTVRLISEKNPVRDMAVFYLGPRAGRAEVSSRIRLNGSQRVLAVAELSDGSFWSGVADVVVTEAACVDAS